MGGREPGSQRSTRDQLGTVTPCSPFEALCALVGTICLASFIMRMWLLGFAALGGLLIIIAIKIASMEISSRRRWKPPK